MTGSVRSLPTISSTGTATAKKTAATDEVDDDLEALERAEHGFTLREVTAAAASVAAM